jgi:type IX secretion system PorP/SprF family membrane protein
MSRLFKILVILCVAGSVLPASAQQLPIYSQYLHNKFLINPAVAGSDGFTTFNLTAREQWVGYSGAPRTVSLSAQTRILKSRHNIRSAGGRSVYRPGSDGRVGIGAYVFSDKNGLIQRTGFQTSYSYHIWLYPETQLSFGLAFTGYHLKINEKEIRFEDPNEPWMTNDLRRGILVPDISTGVHVLNERYTAGFAVEQLFESFGRFGSDAYSGFRMQRHYNVFGTYLLKTGFYSELQPSIMIRMSEQIMPQADIGLTYIFRQEVWAGVSYRTGGAFIANLGMVYQNMYFGYSFDFTTQEIQNVTYGTHEITAAIRFGDSRRRYRWLDRY